MKDSVYTRKERIQAGIALFFAASFVVCALASGPVTAFFSSGHTTVGDVAAVQVSGNETNILSGNDVDVEVHVEANLLRDILNFTWNTNQEVNAGGGDIPMHIRIEGP